MQNSQVTIIGSGITGSVLALYLYKRGYQVELFESRNHSSKSNANASISLDLSERALYAIKEVGVDLSEVMTPLYWRKVRWNTRCIAAQYGTHKDECIYSIERNLLHEKLLEKILATGSIKYYSEHRLQKVDVDGSLLNFDTPEGSKQVPFNRLIGCDGISSKVRQAVSDFYSLEDEKVNSGILYAEFKLPFTENSEEALSACFWPEIEHALVTHPIKAKKLLSSTLLALEGFEIEKAFRHNVLPFDLKQLPQPELPLRSVFSNKWYISDKIVIMGDAAHAMLPFIGQGVNSGLEDCTRFNAYLDQFHDQWDKALVKFEEERKLNTKAASQMSADCISEIFYKSTLQQEKDFQFKKFSLNLSSLHNWIPYSYFLRFSRVPYSEIYSLKVQQEEIIQKLMTSKNLDTKELQDLQSGWIAKNKTWLTNRVLSSKEALAH